MKSLRYRQMLARSFLHPCHQERWKCLKPIIKLCPPSRRGLSGLSSQGWKSNYLSIIWYLFGPMSRRISSTHRIALEHWALVKLQTHCGTASCSANCSTWAGSQWRLWKRGSEWKGKQRSSAGIFQATSSHRGLGFCLLPLLCWRWAFIRAQIKQREMRWVRDRLP